MQREMEFFTGCAALHQFSITTSKTRQRHSLTESQSLCSFFLSPSYPLFSLSPPLSYYDLLTTYTHSLRLTHSPHSLVSIGPTFQLYLIFYLSNFLLVLVCLLRTRHCVLISGQRRRTMDCNNLSQGGIFQLSTYVTVGLISSREGGGGQFKVFSEIFQFFSANVAPYQ